MTPKQEERARRDLEAEAEPLAMLALMSIDDSIVNGNLVDANEEDFNVAVESLSAARELGWDFVRDNAALEVDIKGDSLVYGSLAAGYVLSGSRKIIEQALSGYDLNETTAAERRKIARDVLKARRKSRARIYAIDTVNPAVEAGKRTVIESIKKALGGKITMTWRSVGDSLVRPSHSAADGQTVFLGQYFKVGGYDLRYPRDYLAPAKETANCRCMCVYSSDWSK
jgi:hypothetical protein